MKISLIGYGRLGKLISSFLKRDFDLQVFDKNMDTDLNAIKNARIVILAVPISSMEEVCQQISPYISTETIVVDVCSVKEYPIEIMRKTLPPKTKILGTHPMFGPDSVNDTLFGTKLVLCNESVSADFLNKVKAYLENQGMRLIEVSPTEHDQAIANTLLLSHFIGNGLLDFGAKEELIDTKGYRRLLRILETVKNDTGQLFKDMNKYNRFARPMREKFLGMLTSVSDKSLQ